VKTLERDLPTGEAATEQANAQAYAGLVFTQIYQKQGPTYMATMTTHHLRARGRTTGSGDLVRARRRAYLRVASSKNQISIMPQAQA